jgi:hypothetical protein
MKRRSMQQLSHVLAYAPGAIAAFACRVNFHRGVFSRGLPVLIVPKMGVGNVWLIAEANCRGAEALAQMGIPTQPL